MESAQTSHQSPVQAPAHPYAPGHARNTSATYNGVPPSPNHQHRSSPSSPIASRSALPPHSPTARDRPSSSYYDPTSDGHGAHISPYQARSPVQNRSSYEPFQLPPKPRSAAFLPEQTEEDKNRPMSSGPRSAVFLSPEARAESLTRDMSLGPRSAVFLNQARDTEPNHQSPASPSAARPAPARQSNPMALINMLAEMGQPVPDHVRERAEAVEKATPSEQVEEEERVVRLEKERLETKGARLRSPSPPPAPPPVVAPAPAPAPKTQSRKANRQSSTSQQLQPKVKEEPAHEPPRSRASSSANGTARAALAPPAKPLARTPIQQTGPPGLTVRDTEAAWAEIQSRDLSDVENDFPGIENCKQDWIQRSHKRTLELEITESLKRKRRRLHHMQRYYDSFSAAAEVERAAYLEIHEQEVADEVRLKEISEDKERKKDQQRKRRREKAIADEQLKREDALAILANTDNVEERARWEKEIQRYDKKIRDTQLRLQGITPTKEIRTESPHASAALGRREREVPMEGGLMTSFYSNGGKAEEGTPDAQTGGVKGRGSRGGRGGPGGRARKSKEQKQAEKDRAAGAQAFLDQGQDLPPLAPKEEERLQAYAERQRREESEPLSDAAPAASVEEKIVAAPTGIAKFDSKGYNQIYEQITRDLAKGVPKVARIKNSSLDTKQSNARKTAQLAAKEARRWQLRTNKSTKDVAARAKRAMREMLGFWKRNERDEREGRKAAERQELDKARKAEADREANRQKRKLNFLISQTELYSHFIGKKVKTDEIERHGNDPDGVTPSGQTMKDDPNASHTVDLPDSVGNLATKVTNFEDLDFDAEDETALRQAAMANAQMAVQEAQDRARAFDKAGNENKELSDAQANFDDGEMNFQNPTSLQSMDVEQPKMLTCQLKEYQVKGLNWLVNLYEQGINGILADEMGLGKTVQSISVMAYLAEVHDIWGPFLVIAPASTLHNWQQEITKFVPTIKVLPYWGSAKDRKVLRKFWDRKHITYTRDSPFHVLVTSYQLVVQDTAYFQKVKWQYMILDEAQAIKSSQSSRWKSLLGFHCRNRLLLTGTPIQNNMQELWALLHFIMPSLFDSHDEFSEWFSKDIENHAQSNSKLNEDQLRRLHMILKPFMLRRIKKHVQKELGDKIEEDVFCDLTYRQRAYYTNLRNKISILDLIEKAAVGDDQDTATLMNLVMQFRKVCNHPDLFERAAVESPLSMSTYAETASFMREGTNVNVAYSVKSQIEYWLPKALAEGSGRLDIAGPDNLQAGWRQKALRTDLSIWDERNIESSAKENGAFSWLRFVDKSASEVSSLACTSLLDRAVALVKDHDRAGRLGLAYDYEDEKENDGFTPVHAMFNIVERNKRPSPTHWTLNGALHGLFNISEPAMAREGYNVIEACYLSAATAPPVELITPSQHTLIEKETTFFSVPARRALYPISTQTERALLNAKIPPSKYPVTNLLPTPGSEKQRFTQIQVPSMRRFVTDSGKLAKLDQLLRMLKEGGHRVLLYFQMTRMIDLMEEYLTYRNYKYCRLDGSTKLEDRRDTVAAFQSSPEIFVFLLSTRAGGLGINLTSADTVIFYDSDWNPTIDSQAMDRAHRLGQTRQVTVYRLITRGTIEERIRKRALQKEEVQRVVISGQGAGGVDFTNRSHHRENNRTKEMAMWLADDDQAAAIERREAEVLEEEAKAGGKSRKRKAGAGGAAAKRKEVSMDDMYHEGEGSFEDGASHDPSGAATPVSAMDGPPAKKAKMSSKRAKTVKQRLAVIDGEV